MSRRLPVTLVGGFLGAGKTSLLHHAISEHQGGYLAIMVENPGALNHDSKALRGLCGAMRRQHDTVLEIPSGDEKTQIEWIAAQLKTLVEQGRFERVLLEASGTTNAARLGRYFGLLPDQPNAFGERAELQQIICVVDSLDFFLTRNGPASQASFLDFQDEQIAAASLVVLNKCDLIDDKERELSLRLIRRINPEALVVQTAYGEVPPEIWSKAASTLELSLALERRPPPGANGTETPELTSALYRAYRPFHPERFWNWFNAEHAGLLRVKGLIWLATRNLLVGGISRTRWQNSCGSAGIWWAALPREDWPEEPEDLRRMQEFWREPYGDRRQELVLIGVASRLPGVTQQLNACLLTGEEYACPVKEWTALPDPFPAWDLEDEQ